MFKYWKKLLGLQGLVWERIILLNMVKREAKSHTLDISHRDFVSFAVCFCSAQMSEAEVRTLRGFMGVSGLHPTTETRGFHQTQEALPQSP